MATIKDVARLAGVDRHAYVGRYTFQLYVELDIGGIRAEAQPRARAAPRERLHLFGAFQLAHDRRGHALHLARAVPVRHAKELERRRAKVVCLHIKAPPYRLWLSWGNYTMRAHGASMGLLDLT